MSRFQALQQREPEGRAGELAQIGMVAARQPAHCHQVQRRTREAATHSTAHIHPDVGPAAVTAVTEHVCDAPSRARLERLEDHPKGHPVWRPYGRRDCPRCAHTCVLPPPTVSSAYMHQANGHASVVRLVRSSKGRCQTLSSDPTLAQCVAFMIMTLQQLLHR